MDTGSCLKTSTRLSVKLQTPLEEPFPFSEAKDCAKTWLTQCKVVAPLLVRRRLKQDKQAAGPHLLPLVPTSAQLAIHLILFGGVGDEEEGEERTLSSYW